MHSPWQGQEALASREPCMQTWNLTQEILFFFFFFGLFSFFGPLLGHMEVPRLGVQSELDWT